MIVAAVAEKDADGFFVAGQDALGIDVAAFDIHEAAYVAQHFAEIVGALPGDGEGGDGAGA